MTRFATVLLVTTGLLGSSQRVEAGWVSIKNETEQPVVVLETSEEVQPGRCGKPVRLMPGEVFREFQSCAGGKTVCILECGGQMHTLSRAKLNWGRDDRAYSVRGVGSKVELKPATPGLAVCRTRLASR